MPKNPKPASEHLTDFEPPLYNIWKRIDKDAKESRDKRIIDMWLACYTEKDIADAVGCSQQEVNKIVLPQTAELPKIVKPAAEHLTDFKPPIYNIWKQQKKSSGSNHFGS